MQDLVAIADRNRGRAGVQARGILNFFYGYEYVSQATKAKQPVEQPSTLSNFKLNQAPSLINQYLISVFPNPADEVISFRYDLSAYQGTRVVLQVFDEVDRNIKQMVLDPIAGETQWNTSQLEPGLYLYQLKTNAQVISSGQFLIAR